MATLELYSVLEWPSAISLPSLGVANLHCLTFECLHCYNTVNHSRTGAMNTITSTGPDVINGRTFRRPTTTNTGDFWYCNQERWDEWHRDAISTVKATAKVARNNV